ncbi:MAG TPA: PDGLE domain-containing protein [Planctomycetota bacterium]|jgi:hypothetical protein
MDRQDAKDAKIWGWLPKMSFVLAALGLSLLLVVFVAPLASKAPDGLEKMQQDAGVPEGTSQWQHAPAPEYKLAPVKHEGLSTAIAGVTGTLIVFGAAWALGRAISRRKAADTPRSVP